MLSFLSKMIRRLKELLLIAGQSNSTTINFWRMNSWSRFNYGLTLLFGRSCSCFLDYSGNHAAAVSLAAKLRGIPAYVVIPKNAPACKVENVRRYGGRVIWSEATMESRESTAMEVQQGTGSNMIHPFNDKRIIRYAAESFVKCSAFHMKLWLHQILYFLWDCWRRVWLRNQLSTFFRVEIHFNKICFNLSSYLTWIEAQSTSPSDMNKSAQQNYNLTFIRYIYIYISLSSLLIDVNLHTVMHAKHTK